MRLGRISFVLFLLTEHKTFKFTFLIKCGIKLNCNVMHYLWGHLFRYSADEIHFNLMAIVSDRKMTYSKRIEEITKQIQVQYRCPFFSRFNLLVISGASMIPRKRGWLGFFPQWWVLLVCISWIPRFRFREFLKS